VAVSRPAEQRRRDLVALYREARGCTLCPLSQSRTQVVFGNGNADADLMFVGEAPGFHEDARGLPFVGRAGGLLDELLAEQGLARGDVFVANTLKCRPPDNRDPQPEEIETCRPYLERQVELIEPRVICTLGNFATKLLSGSQRGITQVHGSATELALGGHGVRLYPLFHPAAALRTPRVKEQLREDFARLPELLALAPPASADGDRPEDPRRPAGDDRRPAGDELRRAGNDRRPAGDDQLGLFG
jgi:DNA polymerase